VSAATSVRRPAALIGVREVIQILGVRIFNQLALTVTEAHVALVAARGDAPTGPMQAKRVTRSVGDGAVPC
jgi:hypothetical protein